MNVKLTMVTLITTLNSTNHNTNWIIWAIVATLIIAAIYYLVKTKSQEPQKDEPQSPPTKTQNSNIGKAKDAMLKNINKFIDLLDDLSKNKLDLNKWTDLIIDLNDKDLMNLWKQFCDKPANKWINLLASWGLRNDNCQSFEGSEYYKMMYWDENKNTIEADVKYDVLFPCWILTIDGEDGKSVKKVIKKGVAKKISNYENI